MLALRPDECLPQLWSTKPCGWASHDLAQLPPDTSLAFRSASVPLGGSNPFEWMKNWGNSDASPGRVTPCGRLTYRQAPPAKRKAYDEIAAAQQTLLFSCAGKGRDLENSWRAVHCRDVPRRRQIATSYPDGLGIWAVIGLIEFVRSASGRG